MLTNISILLGLEQAESAAKAMVSAISQHHSTVPICVPLSPSRFALLLLLYNVSARQSVGVRDLQKNSVA